MTTTDYKYDGFQADFFNGGGLHQYTIYKPGPAEGATFYIEGAENNPPTEQTILERVREKERQFGNK